MSVTSRKAFRPGFAIVRYEPRGLEWIVKATSPQELEEAINSAINPIRVLYSRERALAEAKRLNEVNADKGCMYFVTYTRVEVAEGNPSTAEE